MNIDAKDGGPAFPFPADRNSDGHNGMSLRDWFAGHAPDEIPEWFNRYTNTERKAVNRPKPDCREWMVMEDVTWTEPYEDYYFRWKYAFADGLIRARVVQKDTAMPKPAKRSGGPSDKKKLAQVQETLGFFKSVIQSGESWGATCQRAFDTAMRQ